MRLKYLLDTNVLIHIRRKHPYVVSKFAGVAKSDLLLSPISYGELHYGVEKSLNPARAREVLSALISQIEVPPITPDVAEVYSRIRASLSRRGLLIGQNDLWIAAHAMAGDYTLVSDNTREFERVEGLRLENWAREA